MTKHPPQTLPGRVGCLWRVNLTCVDRHYCFDSVMKCAVQYRGSLRTPSLPLYICPFLAVAIKNRNPTVTNSKDNCIPLIRTWTPGANPTSGDHLSNNDVIKTPTRFPMASSYH